MARFLSRKESANAIPKGLNDAAGRTPKMSKCLAVWTVGLIAGLTFLPIIGAQTAAPNGGGNEAKQDLWNSNPLDKKEYVGKKSAPAPRRDLSGVWDGTTEGGGAYEGARELPSDGKHSVP